MKASILLVDDRPANLLALEAVLEPLGQRLVSAASGEEALLRLLEEDFAVILLDVQMPGMDGLQTAEILKARDKTAHVPIIFITAISRETSFVFQGYSLGAVDYLTKPFDPEILRSKVAVFVDLFLKGEKIKQQEALLRHREREDLLRRSEHRYRALTDAMPLCMWVARPDGEAYLGNRVWLEYAGLSPEENAGQGYLRGVYPSDREEVRFGLAEAQSGRPFETQVRLVRRPHGTDRFERGGEARWHLVRTVAEHDETGAIVGLITTATDIDDRRRAEEARAQLLAGEQAARHEAEVASRLKDEFLGTVSHELRTPLTAIVSWARILKIGGIDGEKFARAVETIERNARAQAEMIDNLLDVSDIVTGRVRLNLISLQLSLVIHAAMQAVRPASTAKGIDVTFAIGRDEGPEEGFVRGDPERLHQVIWNLLMNAIAFTPQGGKVHVWLYTRDEVVVVRVSDTGSGISADFLPHVFERFRQGDARTTRAHRGLGVGLAIVRHLVELHGGTVHADSPGEGAGTTITITVPLASHTQEGTSESPPADRETDPPAVEENSEWPR